MSITLEVTLTREEAIKRITLYKGRAEAVLEGLPAKLAKDPAYALEWAQDDIKAAARLRVCNHLLKVMADEAIPLDLLVLEILNETVRQASYPRESTSAVANLMEAYQTATYADLAREFLGI